jgi:hypothetical protein
MFLTGINNIQKNRATLGDFLKKGGGGEILS